MFNIHNLVMEAVRTDVRAQEVLAVSAKVDAALLTATSTLGEVLAEKAEAEAIKGSIEESVSLANEAVALTSELVLKGTLLNSETESIRGLVESLYNTVEYDTSVSREIRTFVESLYTSFNTTYFGGRIEVPDDSEGIVGSMYYDHTMRQLMVKVSETAWKSPCDLVGYISILQKGTPDGVAELDGNGLVPAGQLPSYVDDVLEYSTKADLPLVGETGKIYIVISDETSGANASSYRWTGTVYAMVSNTLTGEDIKVLYESNANTNAYTDAEKAKLAATEIASQLDIRDTANRNRANHTGTQLAETISNLDTAITTSTQVTANTLKLSGIEVGAQVNDVLTVAGRSGDVILTKTDVGLENVDNTSDLSKPISTATQTALNSKSDTSHAHTKVDIGLENVDNTSDWDKPISIATQTALDAHTGLITGNTASILQLAMSNTHGAFSNPSMSLAVSDIPQILPFSVAVPSTNSDRFVINTDNTITAKVVGVYTFTSTLTVEDTGANGSVVALTFKITDGTTVWHTQIVNVEISNFDRDVIPVNSLVLVEEGAILPANAYITVECPVGANGDYTIVGFQSTLATEKTVAELQGLATATIVTPYGTMSSTNVQTALQELVDEKVPLNSDFTLDLGGII